MKNALYMTFLQTKQKKYLGVGNDISNYIQILVKRFSVHLWESVLKFIQQLN